MLDLNTDFAVALYIDLEKRDTPELEKLRYYLRIQAHEGNFYSTLTMRMIDYILLIRIATTLCEVCLGRTGCDMCCPSYFTDYYTYDDQVAHYEQFGRPAFPNEY